MSPTEGRTAVLLDHHPLWLDAVEQLLTKLGVEVIGKATDAEEALILVERAQPDVFIAEIDMPASEVDGLSCVRRAAARAPKMKTIVLSRHEGAQHVGSAFAAGATSYVVKTAHPEDLAVAIRQAFGQSVFFADSYADPRAAAVPALDATDVAPDLTPREREILQLVAEGYSNGQLARMLWVTEQTVKFHLSNIYRKLNVANRTEASRWAQVHGLLPAAAVGIAPAA